MEIIKPQLPRSSTKISGVYQITFDNKWIYIGSSFNLKKRFITWKNRLLKSHFISNKKIISILPETKTINIQILSITDNYKKLEEEIIAKNRGNKNCLNSKIYDDKFNMVKIGCFNMSNELLNVYDGIDSAMAGTGKSRQDIVTYLEGKRYCVYGLRFKVADDNGNFIEHNIRERHPSSSKLSLYEAKKIRKLIKLGMSRKEIQKMYNISPTLVFKIINDKGYGKGRKRF